MKKIFLFMLAAAMLASCDYFKGSSKEDDTEEESPKKKKKKKKAAEEDEEDTENVDDETTTKKKKSSSDDDTAEDEDTTEEANRGWTTRDKTAFITQCVDQAKQNVGDARAKAYCSCMFTKISDKYQSMKEAETKMSESEMNSMAYDCNK